MIPPLSVGFSTVCSLKALLLASNSQSVYYHLFLTQCNLFKQLLVWLEQKNDTFVLLSFVLGEKALQLQYEKFDILD